MREFLLSAAGAVRPASSPAVSIIIPVYNGANYLAQAIESALAQSYKNIEIIVVDDGSNDQGQTESVARAFTRSIRYIRQENGGVATALNTGIQAMRGELFSWLSHDDLYKPDKIARQVELFLRFGAPAVIMGDFEVMDERGRTLKNQPASAARYNLIARPLDAVFHGLINGCALLVPRALFDRVGFFEPGLPTTQDYHMWYRLARAVPFVHCPYADVRQRIHAQQGSTATSHRYEADRMFISLIDATPAELMSAYDQSEIQFLARIHRALRSYSGLRRYLEFRIRQFNDCVSYAVALLPGVDADSAAARLRSLPNPPVDMRSSEYELLSAEVIVFISPARLPSEADLLSAIKAFVLSGADFARPRGGGSDGAMLRSGVQHLLAEGLRGAQFDWEWLAARAELVPSSLGGGAGALSGGRIVARAKTQLALIASRILCDADTALRRIINSTPRRRVRSALSGKSRLDFRPGLKPSILEALLEMSGPMRPTLLFVTHALGGGAHRYLNELLEALKGRANGIVISGDANDRMTLSHGRIDRTGGITFPVKEHLSDLTEILKLAKISRADVHQAAAFEAAATQLLDDLNLPFDVTLVDYSLIANDPHLCSRSGQFVGDDQLLDSGVLRQVPSPLLFRASRVFALCRDMAARWGRCLPELRVIPAIHWKEHAATRVRHVFVPRLWDREPLRILVAGFMVDIKGRRVVLEAARLVAARKLPVRFEILGEMEVAEQDLKSLDPILTIHGVFRSEDFSERLGAIAPHVAWVPSQSPETWSYVLTDLMEAALPIAATAIGAIPERCHGRPYTWLLPLDASPADWVRLFVALHGMELQLSPRWSTLDHLPPPVPVYFEEFLQPASDLYYTSILNAKGKASSMS